MPNLNPNPASQGQKSPSFNFYPLDGGNVLQYAEWTDFLRRLNQGLNSIVDYANSEIYRNPNLPTLAQFNALVQLTNNITTNTVNSARNINTTSPLTGGGNLSADLTLAINSSSANTSNYVVQRDFYGQSISTVYDGTFNTTVTSGGTLNLVAQNPRIQQFTGTQNHTVLLATGNIVNQGTIYWILNNSTGTITVQDHATNLLGTVAAGTQKWFICTANGSSAGTWYVSPALAGGTVTSVTGTLPIVSSGGATPAISINAATATTGGAVPTPPNDSTQVLKGNMTYGQVTNSQIATNTVTNTNLAQMVANTIKGNNTTSMANATDLTVIQTNKMLYAASAVAGNGTAQWVKFGTLTLAQSGQSALIKIIAGSGYSASNTTLSEIYIRFITSNGTAVDANGFAGASNFWYTGQDSSFSTGTIKWKANAAGVSATAFDLYVNMPQFPGGSPVYTVELSAGSWAESMALAQTDPGAASSSVAIPARNFYLNNLFTILDSGNVGINKAAPSQPLDVNGIIQGNSYITHSSTGYRFTHDTGNSYVNGLGGNFGVGNSSPGKTLDITGDMRLANAGNTFFIKEGTNATMGQATLVNGSVVVSTTKVTASSRIFLTVNGGTLTNVGFVYVSARTAGTSFTITSSNASDSSNVAWVIIEPG